MKEEDLYKLRFPIGVFIKPKIITEKHISSWIIAIENLPKSIESLTNNLNTNALNYKYRPDGWTIKQVVHHCADSHINSLMRFKLTLTEKQPIIRPYFEDRFAKLIDYSEPIDASLFILKGVHHKLSVLLRNLNREELDLKFIHPEHGKNFSLKETIGMYAWHSNHHLEHIKQALKFKDKFS